MRTLEQESLCLNMYSLVTRLYDCNVTAMSLNLPEPLFPHHTRVYKVGILIVVPHRVNVKIKQVLSAKH